jgi:hypothetical protein
MNQTPTRECRALTSLLSGFVLCLQIGNLGTGVKDFFYLPAQGLVSSPQDFGRGLIKGTGSLVKKTVYGVLDAAGKITGSVGKVLGSHGSCLLQHFFDMFLRLLSRRVWLCFRWTTTL